MTRALRPLLGVCRRGEQLSRELGRRPDIDQRRIRLLQALQDLIPEGADRPIGSAGPVLGRGKARDLEARLSTFPQPPVAAPVENAGVAVPIILKQPESVGRKPVVAIAVKDDGLAGLDSEFTQDVFKAIFGHPVPDDGILEILLPVQPDSAGNVSLIVECRIFVRFHDADLPVVEVCVQPVWFDQHFRMRVSSHHQTSSGKNWASFSQSAAPWLMARTTPVAPTTTVLGTVRIPNLPASSGWARASTSRMFTRS